MITLTLYEGKEFLDGYEALKQIPLPIKVSYALARASKQIKEDIDFYTTKFQEIIFLYAEKDKDGNYVYTDGGQFIKVQEGKEEECQAKITELEQLETKIDIEPITLADLGETVREPDVLRKIIPIIAE